MLKGLSKSDGERTLAIALAADTEEPVFAVGESSVTLENFNSLAPHQKEFGIKYLQDLVYSKIFLESTDVAHAEDLLKMKVEPDDVTIEEASGWTVYLLNILFDFYKEYYASSSTSALWRRHMRSLS